MLKWCSKKKNLRWPYIYYIYTIYTPYICENQWNSMKINENQWKSMKINDFWEFDEIHRADHDGRSCQTGAAIFSFGNERFGSVWESLI